MMTTERMTVEVAYAGASRQVIRQIIVDKGTTARQVLLQSHLADDFPVVDFSVAPIGVCGKKVKDDLVLHEWDRVEVYRPLLVDPKENRRRRAQQKSTPHANG